MRVYGVVNSSTEDAPLIKREKQTKFATASKIALLTVGLAGGVIAIASGSSSMRVFGLGTSSALAEKCGDLSAIPQCPSAKLGSSEAEKLLDSVQCATSKAQVKMYATGPCAAWPEGHAAQTMSVSKVGRKEMSSKKPSSGSVSGAMNDKTVVADTQKFNQNLQDSVDEAAQQAEAAADNVTDVVQDGFQQVNDTWNEITGQGGEDDDEGDEDEEDSTPSEDEDSGSSEDPAATPSEDEDSGNSEDPTPSEDEDSGEVRKTRRRLKMKIREIREMMMHLIATTTEYRSRARRKKKRKTPRRPPLKTSTSILPMSMKLLNTFPKRLKIRKKRSRKVWIKSMKPIKILTTKFTMLSILLFIRRTKMWRRLNKLQKRRTMTMKTMRTKKQRSVKNITRAKPNLQLLPTERKKRRNLKMKIQEIRKSRRSTPSEDEDSGDSEDPAATPSEDEDSGDSEVPARRRLKMKIQEIRKSRRRHLKMKIQEIRKTRRRRLKMKIREIRKTRRRRHLKMKIQEIRKTRRRRRLKMKIQEIRKTRRRRHLKMKIQEIRKTRRRRRLKMKIRKFGRPGGDAV